MDFSRPLTFQKIKAGLDADGKLIAMNHDVVSAWPTKRWASRILSPSVDKKGALDAFTVNGADFSIPCPITTSAPSSTRGAHATPSASCGRLHRLDLWAVESNGRRTCARGRQGSRPVPHRHASTARAPMPVVRNAAQHLLAAMAWLVTAPTNCRRVKAWALPAFPRRKERPQAGPRAVAHVAVAPSGEVKVKKTDRGHRRRHAGASRQHPCPGRGAALWGLSLAMYEKATLKDGGIEQTTSIPIRRCG